MKLAPENLPSNKKFGTFFCIVFLVLGAYFYWIKYFTLSYVFASLGLITLILTIIKSSLLLPFNKLWMGLGFLLGMIISPIVLGAIFFLIFTPIALITKLIGRDELKLRNKTKETYWVKRDLGRFSPESFKNQF